MIRRLLLLSFSVACIIFISVLVDRIAGTEFNRRGYFFAMPPSTTLVFDTREFQGVATISAQGLRNEPISMPKSPDTFRILALGDSFTFGWGVDLADSWPKLVENKLRSMGKNIEIINAGVPGIGLRRMRLVCRAYKDQFDVDAVILGIHTDDLYQAAALSSSITPLKQFALDTWQTLSRVSERIIEKGDTSSDTALGKVIELSSVWKKRVAESLKQNPTLLLTVAPELRSDFLSGKINPYLVYIASSDPEYLTYVLTPQLLNFAVDSVDARLDRIDERCLKDTPTMVVYIPSPSLISKEYQLFRQKLGFVEDEKLLTIPIDQPLYELSQERGFLFASALSNFRADGCPDCFYPYDGHLTRIGHERLVKILLPAISELLE